MFEHTNQLVMRTEVAGNACENAYRLAQVRLAQMDEDAAWKAINRAGAWFIRELTLYLQLQEEVGS